MKAYLMHRKRDFCTGQELPSQAPELIEDLGLDIVLNAMAGGDAFLHAVAKAALLTSLEDPNDIRYRQAVLRDCLANPSVVRGMYALVVETIERERKHYWGLSTRHPGSILHRSVEMLGVFVDAVRRLRRAAEIHGGRFESEGFSVLFAALRRELDDDYLASIEAHIERLRFRRGPIISACLGAERIAGTELVLRRPNRDDRYWLQRLVSRAPSYTFRVHERDEAGGQIVGHLRDRGISLVANAAGQAVDHMVSFFRMLRAELAFYVGCLNLREKLAARDLPACFPGPRPRKERCLLARGLYDIALGLSSGRETIGNNLAADDKDLLIVTGANQGGKTTWLRAVGQSQLMMQCGLFVPASAFCANVCSGMFVHFRREEDASMEAGKFEEELRRISGIVDRLAPDAMVLFNESLQSTNEREGSEIGRQIIGALLDSRVKVVLVTHMYALAAALYEQRQRQGVFLRAERRADGTRTFRILPGAPLSTSFGKELFEEIFGGSRSGTPAPAEAEPPAAARAQVL